MTTLSETLAWSFTIVMFFIPPLIIFLILEKRYPSMEGKRSLSFFLGWIPGNLVAIGYLSLSIGVIDSIFLLFFTEVIQLIFIIIMERIFVNMFGKDAFK